MFGSLRVIVEVFWLCEWWNRWFPDAKLCGAEIMFLESNCVSKNIETMVMFLFLA